MQYIILSVLLFLNAPLSASGAHLEEVKRNHSNGTYLGFDSFPVEMQDKILNDPDLSPEDTMYFGLASKGNLQLVRAYCPAKLTLGKLRHQIKTIFIKSAYFNNKEEEAIASANLFLEAYFPNENAIISFMKSTINSSDTPYMAFLNYISNAFSKNGEDKVAYFELRNYILANNLEDEYLENCEFKSMFLPPEIGNLTGLENLLLWDTQLTILPPEMWKLTNLRELDLRTTN